MDLHHLVLRCTSAPTPPSFVRRGPPSLVPCPAGFYCLPPTVGNTTTPQACPPGYYCPAGTQFPNTWPCPLGTFGNASNLMNASQCTRCSPGRYCAAVGATTPTGACQVGYYCAGGATSPNPTDGVTGNLCPAGSYCPAGVSTPQLCPAGTFSPDTGAWNASSCRACPAGQYCATPGLTAPTGNCSAGYYCPADAFAGQTQPAPPAYPCPRGFYCPAGAAEPLQCDPGTYSDTARSGSCAACPAGFYCNRFSLVAGVGCPACDPFSNYTVPTRCPLGFFCPAGTALPGANPCPGHAIALGVFSHCCGAWLCVNQGWADEYDPVPQADFDIPSDSRIKPKWHPQAYSQEKVSKSANTDFSKAKFC